MRILNRILEKKLKLTIICMFAVFSVNFPIKLIACQYSYPFELTSASALLIDANTGQIVYSHNPHQRFQPASLAKVMALFLIFDAIEKDVIQLNDEIVISKQAADKKGSTMYLREGEKVPLAELVKGIAIVSGNDASIAAAEGAFGSEQDLVKLMNEKLLTLHLQNSKFQTVDGWPVPEQYTTAYDMAMLARAFIQAHPEMIKYHQLKEFTHADIILHNRNGLILKDPSIDGLKTGHVEESGYHLIATAERQNQRYITVIMGADNIETREKEAMQLLNFGFNNLTSVKLFNKNKVLSHLPVLNGEKDEVGLRPLENGVITIPASQKEFVSYELEAPKQQEAPIVIDQQLGQVIISCQEEFLKTIPLVANENIPLANSKLLAIKSISSGMIRYKNILFVIFFLLCALGMFYLYFRKPRHRFKKTDSTEAQIVKQRLDKMFESKNE